MKTATKTANYECPLLKDKDKTKVKDFGDGRLRTGAQDFCLNHCRRRECLEVIRDRKMRPKLTRVESGSLGGQATARKHHDLLAEWGREGGLRYAANLLRHGSNGHKQIQEGARGDLIASGSGEW